MSEPFPTLTSKTDLERGAVLAPRFGADGLVHVGDKLHHIGQAHLILPMSPAAA